MTSGAEDHRAAAAAEPEARRAAVAVLTISDSRTVETDHSGARAVACLESEGHRVVRRDLVPDEPEEIRRVLRSWQDDPDVAVIVTTGGTGLSPRDVTVDVARALLSRDLPGFGELFRRLSADEIGPAAMLSRAMGGVIGHGPEATLLFCLPGSTGAVETALRHIIVPELPHMIGLLRRGEPTATVTADRTGVLHGVDLVEVSRIERMLAEHAERFRARCFTEGEQRYCDGHAVRSGERYAARFAAKEAVLKAIGTGWRDGIAWTDIEVVSEPSGRPTLELHGTCAALADRLGVRTWTLSLTHAGGFAFASVVAV